MKARRKFILIFVTFALANVTFYAIINFHMYRIFGKELTKIDHTFIKKDENTTISYALHVFSKSELSQFVNFMVIPDPIKLPILSDMYFFYGNFFYTKSVSYSTLFIPVRGSPFLV